MAYTVMKPEAGYVQGMSYIAANIYFTLKDELQTFIVLSNMMGKEDMLNDFYKFKMDEINDTFHIFD